MNHLLPEIKSLQATNMSQLNDIFKGKFEKMLEEFMDLAPATPLHSKRKKILSDQVVEPVIPAPVHVQVSCYFSRFLYLFDCIIAECSNTQPQNAQTDLRNGSGRVFEKIWYWLPSASHHSRAGVLEL